VVLLLVGLNPIKQTIIIYIVVGDSKCLEGSMFLPKLSGFAKEASCDPIPTISVMNVYLSQTYNLINAKHYWR